MFAAMHLRSTMLGLSLRSPHRRSIACMTVIMPARSRAPSLCNRPSSYSYWLLRCGTDDDFFPNLSSYETPHERSEKNRSILHAFGLHGMHLTRFRRYTLQCCSVK